MTNSPHLDLFLDWATDPRLAVLDTETTGFHGEVIELGIVDAWGRTLFNERIRPSCPIEPGAQAVHGITDPDVQDCPSIAAFWPRLRDILSAHRIVIYNKAFDVPRLSDTLDAAMPQWYAHPSGRGHSDEYKPFQTFCRSAECVMEAYAPLAGLWNDHHRSWRWAKLRDACIQRGVQTDDLRAHAALDDALATLRLIQATALLTPADLPWLNEEVANA
ncbi:MULTISPECIES: 3'-5' exonuclease [Deinococcus]|uniref:3'-5' exonuclease n=1 Tax=Deinococcus rhizophilus TaxID=3049544 RepID=A0ABT7JDM4_9DEIO|nr:MULTISPECIES: 3'-5' exonuclease [Deinococcus]MDL2342588.1 3'-5' exonuclease [Deinococcus rhizophilus]